MDIILVHCYYITTYNNLKLSGKKVFGIFLVFGIHNVFKKGELKAMVFKFIIREDLSKRILNLQAMTIIIKGGIHLSQYVCMVCNYIYYEREGKAFEDLPEDWTCPQCGAPKTHFQ